MKRKYKKKFKKRSYKPNIISINDEIIGIVTKKNKNSVNVIPVDRKIRKVFKIKDQNKKIKVDDLVRIKVNTKINSDKFNIELIEGKALDKPLSNIAIHKNNIPYKWPDKVKEELKQIKEFNQKDREDLTEIPLVTIDGQDAKDFDDAVWAGKNKNDEWHLIIAIADVSFYVQPNTNLDKEAFKRGNSTYFPDQVIPMLPELLSNNLCSLIEDKKRPCLAVHIHVNNLGEIIKYNFSRSIIKSRARLTYEQVQDSYDGKSDAIPQSLITDVIKPLYEVYELLHQKRLKRGSLELDIIEKKIIINNADKSISVKDLEKYKSHKIIEELMITANIAAAMELSSRKVSSIYRVHDMPNKEKLQLIDKIFDSYNLCLSNKKNITPQDFNKILNLKTNLSDILVKNLILRSQSQAKYNEENLGHFGLGLSHYTHFTSPIRRYSDLLVHRELLKRNKNSDSQNNEQNNKEIADYISFTERRSVDAERETYDRYIAKLLSNRKGSIFKSYINGLNNFGLFITLEKFGGDGFIPIRYLPADYYDLFDNETSLSGRNNGLTLRIGDSINSKLIDANPQNGRLIFKFSA